MSVSPGKITHLLGAAKRGNGEAESQLLELVYDELRRLAASYLRRERPDHTLQTTDLVHEAYLRLTEQQAPAQNRAHFFGIAAQLMRRILVDHARSRRAGKRGGGKENVPQEEGVPLSAAKSRELLGIDEALTRLAMVDPRQSRIVELRYCDGLTVEETAGLIGSTSRTVNRYSRMAQAWLRRELGAKARE